MPRKRLIYETKDELLKELVEGTRTLNSVYTLKFRTLNIYNDQEQYNLICDVIKMYLASQKIKNIKF